MRAGTQVSTFRIAHSFIMFMVSGNDVINKAFGVQKRQCTVISFAKCEDNKLWYCFDFVGGYRELILKFARKCTGRSVFMSLSLYF